MTGVPPPLSARDRLEEALARIADPNGEGSRARITVYSQVARNAADAAHASARAGMTLGPFYETIFSSEDLCDGAGEATLAGSKVLVDAPPAASDALPLPRAGALPVGLMLVARNGHDRRLFRMAAAVERLFQRDRCGSHTTTTAERLACSSVAANSGDQC